MSSCVVRRAILAFTLGLAASSAACGTDLSGCWEGSWRSCLTGHSGILRATFTPCDEGRYRVDFSGRFFRILPFRYAVTLEVVEDAGGGVRLAGSSDLGRLFGTFRCTATADDVWFRADYTSAADTGTFAMRRTGR